jgi:hypothetical protein
MSYNDSAVLLRHLDRTVRRHARELNRPVLILPDSPVWAGAVPARRSDFLTTVVSGALPRPQGR